MLLDNARCGDFVTVSKKDDEFCGLHGEIVERTDTKVKIMVYGKILVYSENELTLIARAGRSLHDDLSEKVKARETNHLGTEGYDELINLAIDMQEWAWATDLVQRKKDHIGKKR